MFYKRIHALAFLTSGLIFGETIHVTFSKLNQYSTTGDYFLPVAALIVGALAFKLMLQRISEIETRGVVSAYPRASSPAEL